MADIELSAVTAQRLPPMNIATKNTMLPLSDCQTLNFATSAIWPQPSSNDINGIHHRSNDENAMCSIHGACQLISVECTLFKNQYPTAPASKKYATDTAVYHLNTNPPKLTSLDNACGSP